MKKVTKIYLLTILGVIGVAAIASIVQTIVCYLLWLILTYAIPIPPPTLISAFALQFVLVVTVNLLRKGKGE